MSEVVVIPISRDELRAMLREQTQVLANTAMPADESNVYGHVVDRNYLRINFKWSRRRIEELERANKLRPVFTGDAKSRYYKLGDCIRLDAEINHRP
jgi:hypothetical protein